MNKMSKRQAELLEMLIEKGKVEVVELSEKLNVSQVTIRKDLDQLENLGLIKRAHGFATLNSQDDINIRLAYHYDTKLNIAKKACELIEDGETIMIESGSCCALLASMIANTKKDVTIITNSAFIADYIRKSKNTHIILLGGEYQLESQVNVGPITRACVEVFHVDKLFIGADGYSEKTGFTGNDLMRSVAVKDMAKQANKVYVVTESNKFNQIGTVSLLNSSDVYGVVTDSSIDETSRKLLFKQNIQLIECQ